MTFADEWPKVAGDWHNRPGLNAPQELAQMTAYGRESDVRATLASIDLDARLDQEQRPGWFARLRHRLADMLAWLGRPFTPYQYQMPDGVLFGADGQTYTDTTTTLKPDWRNVADTIWSQREVKPHRVPAPPWPGWEYVEGVDALTGWPYHQLKRVLPEGCADCESSA